MTIVQMCEVADVSRAGWYRRSDEPTKSERDIELRDAIQKVALEMPSYGRRRITAELRRRGYKVNHKRVARIMREDNLLCLRRRKFIATTDSRHSHPIYPNLASKMNLTGVNQLWVADITYIRLETEFVYLAVVLDAFSRRVIGWALDRTLEANLALAALSMALEQRRPAPGLVHHSDRGVQYACSEYTDLLKDHDITVSMSRKGNPYDKAYASYCTSFAHCATTGFMEALLENLTPWAFRGGLAPGCSYRQSFLPLYAWPRISPWRFQILTR
jgi:putative transposase